MLHVLAPLLLVIGALKAPLWPQIVNVGLAHSGALKVTLGILEQAH